MTDKKILFVDISLSGHRLPYVKALAEGNPGAIALLPEKSEEVLCKQFVMHSNYERNRNLRNYWKWLVEICDICKAEHVDLVHFLCGDALYRFFGLGLHLIPCPIVVTYHQMRFSPIRRISYRRIFKASKVGIVHTDYILQGLKSSGIMNAEKANYPIFSKEALMDKAEAKRMFGLREDIPCLVALGGITRYKGLDILLEALKRVKLPFQLHIAGKAIDFDEAYIREQIKDYASSVVCNLRRISDEEFSAAAAAADIIVLPYRFEFEAASGPMTEGIWNRKYIVGAEHGSLGSIIRNHKLGRTFKTENPEDLASVLNEVLSQGHEWTAEAELYRESLTIEYFLSKHASIYESAL